MAIDSMSSAPGRIRGAIADIRDEQTVGEALACFGRGFSDRYRCSSKVRQEIFCARLMRCLRTGSEVVVDIDLNGTFNVMRRAYEYLSKPGACVINITAPQSYIPMRYQIHVVRGKSGSRSIDARLGVGMGF